MTMRGVLKEGLVTLADIKDVERLEFRYFSKRLSHSIQCSVVSIQQFLRKDTTIFRNLQTLLYNFFKKRLFSVGKVLVWFKK